MTQATPTLGEYVKHLRRQRGYTQAELAKRADINSQTVSRLERGEHEPTVSVLRLVASALDVPVSTLLTYEDA